jgi:hypothetical protein
LFSRKSILISGKEKICAVFLCLQREKKWQRQYNTPIYSCLHY